MLSSAHAASVLSEQQARAKAIDILKGDPYGNTPNEVSKNIKQVQFAQDGNLGKLRLPLRFGVCGIVFALSLMVMAQSAYAQGEALFSNNNIDAVQNGSTQQTVVRLSGSVTITKITTYHWNNARGTAAIGTIALRSDAGQLYGPWQAEGEPGQGGVPNAYWVAYPTVSLPAGTYTAIDSDPMTWAQNATSGGAGMTWAEGYIQ